MRVCFKGRGGILKFSKFDQGMMMVIIEFDDGMPMMHNNIQLKDKNGKPRVWEEKFALSVSDYDQFIIEEVKS